MSRTDEKLHRLLQEETKKAEAESIASGENIDFNMFPVSEFDPKINLIENLIEARSLKKTRLVRIAPPIKDALRKIELHIKKKLKEEYGLAT